MAPDEARGGSQRSRCPQMPADVIDVDGALRHRQCIDVYADRAHSARTQRTQLRAEREVGETRADERAK